MHQPTALEASVPGGWNQRIPDQQIVSSLRGPAVDVDARRAARIAIALGLVGLTVAAALLLVAGFQKNAQTARLKDHGVEIPVTVAQCLGQLGGSGSNPAGFACTGTYVYRGHHYQRAIPGTGLTPAGSVVTGVIDPADPALLSTPAVLAREQVSGAFLIVPLVLLGLAGVSCLALWRRRNNGSAVRR